MRNSRYETTTSWVLRLIFINIIIYFFQHILYNETLVYLGLTPALVVEKGFVWQLFTYMFLHGNFAHIFFNMYALLLFGMPVEQLWGSKKFLKYYFFTGVGAGITILVVNLLVRGDGLFMPTIGASGAVFGLLLAFGMLFPNTLIYIYFFFPLKAKYFVIIYGLIELFYGFSGAQSNVAHFAHLGGMVFGFFLIIYWKKKGRLY